MISEIKTNINEVVKINDESWAIKKSYYGARFTYHPLRGWSSFSWCEGDEYFHRCLGSESEAKDRLISILSCTGNRPELNPKEK